MRYAEELNGYWEEGYHYYLEFRDKKLTVRDYRRSVQLETEISYDAKSVKKGERTVISLKDNVLSRTYNGEPFTMIRELAWTPDGLELLYYYTIMGETLYKLHKVDHGPFDHIRIRDDEYLARLQGVWEEWSENKKIRNRLTIRGNTISGAFLDPSRFHVVSYNYSPDDVYLVPENLIDNDFPGYTRFEVLPDMLTTRMIVMDASVPLSVFARPDMVDKIAVPDAARGSIRSTMMYMPDDRPLVDVLFPKRNPGDSGQSGGSTSIEE